LATNPTLDGETTAMYITKLLKEYPVTITRLASGLPMGASLDYADELTLLKAMQGRIKQ
ncbi:MAG: recombination protein RecR, partial [Erysipelotrichaceae bacterium]|nr:recombination protein RecR [Erysipelotrichaceae bacterium]